MNSKLLGGGARRLWKFQFSVFNLCVCVCVCVCMGGGLDIFGFQETTL